MDIVFISDFFSNQILGGGELSDEQLILMLKEENTVTTINSSNVSLDFLEKNKKSKIIVSNFAGLRQEAKQYIVDNLQYIVYEHDHKYLPKRNPSLYKDYLAPKQDIINLEFYANSRKVFCQSGFHKTIVEKNLSLDNITSVGGNLWSLEALEYLKELSKKDKRNACSIMDSNIPHKNTKKAVAFCKYKKYEYDLVKSSSYKSFLDSLSNNKKLVFFPETPETLSRIVVEARMAGMETITSKNIGAIGEDWFSLKGSDLIDVMIDKRQQIKDLVLESIK